MTNNTLNHVFVDMAAEYLKPIGYKKYGSTFVYTGKEVRTVINIQGGRMSDKISAYSMINVSYANLENNCKSIKNADFFVLRHDDFEDGRYEKYTNQYPITFDYKDNAGIEVAMKALKEIEVIVRKDTIWEIEKEYRQKMQSNSWYDVFSRLQ
jgi:hypothetical protein